MDATSPKILGLVPVLTPFTQTILLVNQGLRLGCSNFCLATMALSHADFRHSNSPSALLIQHCPMYGVKNVLPLISKYSLTNSHFRFAQILAQLFKISRENLRTENYDDSSLLWVDTLCINQTDLQERSHQVNMMGKIYSKADRVLIWLGEESQDSYLAMD